MVSFKQLRQNSVNFRWFRSGSCLLCGELLKELSEASIDALLLERRQEEPRGRSQCELQCVLHHIASAALGT